MTVGGDWRVSDAQREAAATALGMHLAAGRLSMEEFRARLDMVYAATTAHELAQATADLPASGPGMPGPGMPGPGARPVPDADLGSLMSDGRRALTRVLGAAALLVASGVTGVLLLIAALAGHGSLLVAGLVLLFAPVAVIAATAGALVWAGRRAWRSGAWLEAPAAAMGMPWAGGAARALRLMAVSRVFLRLAGLVGRPLRARRSGRPARSHGSRKATAWFQDEPGGEWHQAQVRGADRTAR